MRKGKGEGEREQAEVEGARGQNSGQANDQSIEKGCAVARTRQAVQERQSKEGERDQNQGWNLSSVCIMIHVCMCKTLRLCMFVH